MSEFCSFLRLSNIVCIYCVLEKAVAPHSSVLAWRIPGMGEPGGLPSQGSHRVGHDCSDLAAAAEDYVFFIDSFVDRHLGCLHLLAVVNNAANMCVQICVWVLAFNFFEFIPSRGIARSRGNSIFNFLRNCYTLFHSGCTILRSW